MGELRRVGGAAPPCGPYDADIVILAHGRVRETLAAIASALSQTGVSRHLTVLDQASAPGALAAFAAAVDGRADAQLLRSDANLGVGGGRNAATAAGHARHVVALDNDATFAAPGIVARACAVLDADPSLAACGFRIVIADDGSDDLLSWGYPRALLPLADGIFQAATFVGAGHAIRRSAWDAAGPYDPTLFFTWEEYDWCLRAIAADWRIVYRGDLVVRHAVSADRRVDWTAERWRRFVRNRLVIERKWGASALSLAPRIAGYCARGARNGLLRQTLAAIPDALRAPVAARRMPELSRRYLAGTDGAYRDGAAARLVREGMARLPGLPPVPAR